MNTAMFVGATAVTDRVLSFLHPVCCHISLTGGWGSLNLF